MSRDAYVDWEEGVLSEYAAHQHHVTGQTIDIDGDTAHVESYVVYFLVPRDRGADRAGTATLGRASTSEKTRLGSGHYIERWVRRDGDWKILVREYVEDLALLGDTVDLCTVGRCLGSWDRTDLSYVRPLEHQTPEQRQARVDANRQPRHPAGPVADEPAVRHRRTTVARDCGYVLVVRRATCSGCGVARSARCSARRFGDRRGEHRHL